MTEPEKQRLHISKETLDLILGMQGEKKKKKPIEGKPEPIMTMADLRRPEPECQLPEPVRTEENPYPNETCPHCGLVFMLMTDAKGTYWVSKEDHELMIRQTTKHQEPERKEYVERKEYPHA